MWVAMHQGEVSSSSRPFFRCAGQASEGLWVLHHLQGGFLWRFSTAVTLLTDCHSMGTLSPVVSKCMHRLGGFTTCCSSDAVHDVQKGLLSTGTTGSTCIKGFGHIFGLHGALML